ncbi:hypothetical protein [Cohaesibacter gelatinilyticus]|uniref:Uncharacterized protein n=1 Tax=Cohaesibacter gelatinilyticus TaxID=372072 RepID=A0A285PKB1_9HYPH|nr:hypothetical protein [Cohaesibacter gelatinilyticus]SNZ21697.1 hypothetical protein SAMN06265368_4822 [Cohaesibacter gelatinilyticus]
MKTIGELIPSASPVEVATVDAERQQEVTQWLASRSPRDIPQVMQQIARKHGVTFKTYQKLEYPEGGFRSVTIGCSIGGKIKNAKAVAGEIDLLLTPMAEGGKSAIATIEAWLAELNSICARRSEDQTGQRVSLASLSSRLQDYPVDVVRYVLLVKSWKWFPTWHDLKGEADAIVSERKELARALRNAKPKPPKKRQMTKEERIAHADEVMRAFREAKAVKNDEGHEQYQVLTEDHNIYAKGD